MNVFDFDGTIYKGDSERDFFFYLLKHYPKTWKNVFPVMIYGLGYLLHIVNTTKFKSKTLGYVKYIDVDKALGEFWESHEKNIKKWYLAKHQDTDIVISASPRFILEPICEKLGIKCLMATNADTKTGIIEGINCHGKEKVKRFRELFPDAVIDEFYSDLYCDTPMAEIAGKAYIVKGENLFDWNKKSR